MPQGVRKLSFSHQAESFLASCDDVIDAYLAAASILADPSADNQHKFSADHFPYVGARILLDDSWYIVYHVNDVGDVYISSIMRRGDIDRIGQLIEEGY